MAMSREQMDEIDRRMAGITPYTPQPSPPMTDVEGRPITRSYSLDDIRRFLGIGGARPAMSPAEAADAAEMVARSQAPAPFAPNAPMPPPPAPLPAAAMPAPPRSAVGGRPQFPRATPGLMPSTTEAMPMANIVPPATPGAAPANVEAMLPPIPPVPLANPNRVDPQMLARVLMRGNRPPLGNEMAPLSPGSEMQVGPAPLGGMPVEAQADQTMRSVSRVNPQSFGQRFRGVMTR